MFIELDQEEIPEVKTQIDESGSGSQESSSSGGEED